MASSVARMPREDWTGQNLFVGSHGKHLKKLHVPKISIPSSKQKADVTQEAEPEVLTPSRRQNQKILDRWAARQAREMVTTIERQAHEAEISALTSVSQPVSKRAQCFLHRREKETSPVPSDMSKRTQCFLNRHEKEPSPTPSDMSVVSAPGADVLQTVRASSLIQMWRDLEGSTPRAAAANATLAVSWPEENEQGAVGRGKENANGVTVRAVVRGRGEIEKLVARMESERKREICFISDLRVVSQFQYRGRLQSMLRLRFLRKEVPDWDKMSVPPTRVKQEQSKMKYLEKTQSGRKIFTARQNLKCEVQGCNNPATTDESCSNSNIDPTIDSTADSSQTSKHNGNPLESPEMKSEKNRPNVQSQPDNIEETSSPKGDKRHEALNPHQTDVPAASTNNIIFQDYVATVCTSDNIYQADVAHPSTINEISQAGVANNDIYQADDEIINSIEFLCASDEALLISKTGAVQQEADITNVETEEIVHSVLEDEPDPDGYPDDGGRLEEEIESNYSGLKSPSYTNNDDFQVDEEDMSGVSRSPASSWDERNLWLQSVDWQRSIESSTPNSWRGDVVPVEDLGAFPWSCDSPNSWKALVFRDVFENISDNVEIRDLLERRRVTTTLESDFCAKMNRMILSLLQRQAQYNNVGDNFEEELEEKPYWRLNYKLTNANPIPSASSSLVPFNYHNNTDNNWHTTTFVRNLHPQNSIDADSVNQLRSDMSQIHDEISELRKLVESCMQWQVKLQDSIKNEVANAVLQAVGSSTIPSNCRVCKEALVNSLLYRCGHMCACFKCGQNLKLNGLQCPICQSLVEDVVRVNSGS